MERDPVIDLSVQPSSDDLRTANEHLIVESLRQQERAERATSNVAEVTRRLERQSLLAQATELLDSSLNVTATLQRVARMVVPTLADWCIVDLAGGGESPGEVAVAHANAQKEAHLRELEARLASGRTDGSWEGSVGNTDVGQVDGVGAAGQAGQVVGSAADQSGFVSKVFGVERQQILHDIGARAYICVPLKARDRVIGALTLVSSESNRRFEQDELDFAEELARRASVAIDNARLYQDALAAVRLRDDVLAVVTHDLRDPLNSIAMVAEALLNQRADPTAPAASAGSPGYLRKVETIRRSVDHLRRMIDELLEMATIQSGRLVLNRAPERLSSIVAEVFDMLDPLARKKSLQLETVVPDEPCVFVCDRGRLIRVLTNLVGNAIKFTGKGGRIAVHAAQADGKVWMTVRDTGPGIAADDLSRLFQPYWKGKETGQKGTGLGLFIAQRIAEAHGGRIQVESELGVGSTFAVEIPLVS